MGRGLGASSCPRLRHTREPIAARAIVAGAACRRKQNRGRAALAVYDDSDGSVLLLAALRDNSDGVGPSASSHRSPSTRAGVLAAGHVDVDLFPSDAFQFSADGHVLVLAETKRKAEEAIFFLQVCETGGRPVGVDGAPSGYPTVGRRTVDDTRARGRRPHQEIMNVTPLPPPT